LRQLCAHEPRLAERSEIIPDMKHCPEYEMQSAPWMNVSSPTSGTAARIARTSSSVFSRARTTRSTPISRMTRAPLSSCTVICVEPWISNSG
jgi:hypothetical protein